MGFLMEILIGAGGSILAAEIWARAEPLGRWIINRAAARLSGETRDKFREEWLAHMNEVPGAVGKLYHAAGCWRAALVSRAALDPVMELHHKLRALLGDANYQKFLTMICRIGFDAGYDAAFDAGADARGRRHPDHEAIAAAWIRNHVQDLMLETDEGRTRRLLRRYRAFPMCACEWACKWAISKFKVRGISKA